MQVLDINWRLVDQGMQEQRTYWGPKKISNILHYFLMQFQREKT